jgi:hypothetical protein
MVGNMVRFEKPPKAEVLSGIRFRETTDLDEVERFLNPKVVRIGLLVRFDPDHSETSRAVRELHVIY